MGNITANYFCKFDMYVNCCLSIKTVRLRRTVSCVFQFSKPEV